jgi:hypothetical protein
MKFAKEKDPSSELIITLIIPVVIYLINVIWNKKGVAKATKIKKIR